MPAYAKTRSTPSNTDGEGRTLGATLVSGGACVSAGAGEGSSHAHGHGFAIVDPYDAPGAYVKAQLHVHTERSRGGEWNLAEAAEHYRQLGFSFLCITDHGKVTVRSCIDMGGILVVPGEENTVPDPFWPFGRHMLRLFVSSPASSGRAQERIDSCVSQGGVVALAHPAWPGNLGTGRWRPEHLRSTSNFRLIEVRNLHSDEDLDTSIWHSVLAQRMPDDPVWAVAVDDARCAGEAGYGWIEIKVPEITVEAFREALIAGRFYATTGPKCVFSVRGSAICARTERPSVIKFINREGAVVSQATRATEAQYAPAVSDRFVRVEVVDSDGKRGWSQPFTIAPLPIRVESNTPSCTEGSPGPA